ncbi:hypothetical protein N7456_012804 [Penicillium angulare]|uniref:FAD synthase n=1 Tax=Penicillium angulare TaxID=116970 RepID=A0A9W9EKB3_9EURO|nr:hypothetical protein N7456_012804 [Penicillium angulare]
MAEPVIPDERPTESLALSQSIAQALDHLRPFGLGPANPNPSQRGADAARTVHPTPATAATQQNGSAQEKTDNFTGSSDINTNETIPPLPIVIEHIHARVQAFLAETHPADSLLASVQRQTRISLDVVANALQKYKLSGLSLSYNGGKDCLVLLILFLAGLHPYSDHAESAHKPESLNTTTNKDEGSDSGSLVETPVIPAIYALPPDPFPAVEDFVLSSARAYHLSIKKYTTEPPHTTLRSSFEDYLSMYPNIRGIFVGTRRTDPHGAKLTHFDRTDGGWPDFMRIHPVIDWHYAEIWAFIRHLGLSYCSLYDMGYTSLGGTSDTLPNPRLKKEHIREGNDEGYLPAYELMQDLEERLGRN